jgi:hypothetical protein
MIGHGRPVHKRKEAAAGQVKTGKKQPDEEKLARDAERKAKRDAETSVGIDVNDIKRATAVPTKRGAAPVVIDDNDADDIDSSASPPSSSPREDKTASPSFNGAPEDLPESTVPRDPTEEIGDHKEPAYGRGRMYMLHSCFV